MKTVNHQQLEIVGGGDMRELVAHVSGHSHELFRLGVRCAGGCIKMIKVRVRSILRVDAEGIATKLLVEVWSRYRKLGRGLCLPRGLFECSYNASTRTGCLVV